jgi:hypothetical protein
MEVSDARNLDCVHMSVQYLFSGSQTDSSCCAEANIVPGTILFTYRLVDYWLGSAEPFVLAGA